MKCKCGTEMIVSYEGRGAKRIDFCPVCEGTPAQFWGAFRTLEWDIRELEDEQVAPLIAARDAAMRAKGFAEGRLKGLEEAAEVAEAWGWSSKPDSAHGIRDAIRAAAEKEGGE